MGVDFTTIMAFIQTWIALHQAKLDEQNGRHASRDLDRERLLRRRGLDVGHTIKTPPPDGALSLSLVHLGRDQAGSPYVVAGGLLVALPGEPSPVVTVGGDIIVMAQRDDPIVVDAPPAWPPRVRFVTGAGEPARLRRILDDLSERGETMFTLTPWIEEYDGTVMWGRTAAYWVAGDWYENMRLVS